MKHKDENTSKGWFERLESMTGEPIIVKDSDGYQSKTWTEYKDAQHEQPVQRELLSHEIVLDIDKCTESDMVQACAKMDFQGVKFFAWKSSSTGLHIHIFSELTHKEHKVELTKLFKKYIESTLKNVEVDLNPIRQGFIRAEFSRSPKNGEEKVPFYRNCDKHDYMNNLTEEVKQAVSVNYNSKSMASSSTKPTQDRKHGCLAYIESNVFADGRKRLMFCLISYYKHTMSDEQVADKVMRWAQANNMSITRSQLMYFVKQNKGLVGCSYRHALLEELGHSFKCDRRID